MDRTRLILFFVIISFIFSGCSSIPFKKTDYFAVDDVDPIKVRHDFINLSPEKYKIINTVIFKYRTRQFLTLGYVSIDKKERLFEMVGMNPMGIKLIELVGRNNKLEVVNVIDAISKRGDVSGRISEDIYRMYFDQIPSLDAKIYKKEETIVFNEKKDLGNLEYVFAGKDNLLVEKRYLKGRKKIWAVNYYEYVSKDGKMYPQGIILSNYFYKYKLIVNIKDII